MCLVKLFGVGTVINFTITELVCGGCGCMEGWKEIGQSRKLVILGHSNEPGLGIYDELGLKDPPNIICPGCGEIMSPFLVGCKRQTVAMASVKITQTIGDEI